MKPLAWILTLALSAAAQTMVVPPVLSTGATPIQPSTRYDVVLNYHASGSATTTTGTIAASSNSLTVASSASFTVGEGIYVAGAIAASTANPGGDLIANITAISGATLTLAANATVSVSGALVQHDDTAAINNAIADAFNNGGGVVWFRATGVDGVYRCSGIADPATGGILTFPQRLGIGNTPVALLGESPQLLLDFTLAPNVAGNSAVSTAPFVAATSGNYSTIFEPVNVIVDNLNFNVPAQSKLNGLMFSNAEQAKIGDNVSVYPAPDAPGVWNQPTGNSTGIWMPQAYNYVLENLGSAKVVFFNHCLVPGEHTRLAKPYLYGCNSAMHMYGTFHDVTGSVTIESSPIMLDVDSSVNSVVPVDIKIDGEGWGQGWMARGANDIIDTGGRLFGNISYLMYARGSGANGMQWLNRSGAVNVQFHNLQAPDLFGASGIPLPTCNANLENTKEVVYDAVDPTYLGVYVGGNGGTVSPVICNGTNWVTY